MTLAVRWKHLLGVYTHSWSHIRWYFLCVFSATYLMGLALLLHLFWWDWCITTLMEILWWLMPSKPVCPCEFGRSSYFFPTTWSKNIQHASLVQQRVKNKVIHDGKKNLSVMSPLWVSWVSSSNGGRLSQTQPRSRTAAEVQLLITSLPPPAEQLFTSANVLSRPDPSIYFVDGCIWLRSGACPSQRDTWHQKSQRFNFNSLRESAITM